MLLFIFLRLTLWRASYPSSSHTQYGQISLSYKVHFLQQTVQFNLSHASNPYYFFLPYCSPPVWPPCPTSPFPFPATPSGFFSSKFIHFCATTPSAATKWQKKNPKLRALEKNSQYQFAAQKTVAAESESSRKISKAQQHSLHR